MRQYLQKVSILASRKPSENMRKTIVIDIDKIEERKYTNNDDTCCPK